MRVGLTMQSDNVLLTELVQRDGSWVAASSMQVVGPDHRVGHVPYERLRAMGDGTHELPDDGPPVPCRQSRNDSLFAAGSWFFFATVSLLAAPLSYSFYAGWEAHGGRIRVNWLMGLIYGLGGKLAVATTFAVVGVILAVMGVRCLVLTASRWRRKLQGLEETVAAIADLPGGQHRRMTVCNPATGHSLWLWYRQGRFQIVVPEAYLTPKQARRAAATLELCTVSGDANADQVTSTGWKFYTTNLGSDPRSAALRVARMLHKIYGLHLSCEVQWQVEDPQAGQPTEWPDEQPASDVLQELAT